MKIIQLILGPDTQRWQGSLIGLGDDGKVYFESFDRDDEGRVIGRIWEEYKILPPREASK